MRTRKSDGSLGWLQVICPQGHVIETKDTDWSHSDDPCEDCGSHGHIGIYYYCLACNKHYELVLSEW